jgi:hypothetical protein
MHNLYANFLSVNAAAGDCLHDVALNLRCVSLTAILRCFVLTDSHPRCVHLWRGASGGTLPYWEFDREFYGRFRQRKPQQ